MSDPEGLLDTSTLLLLPRIGDPSVLPDVPLISAITLAELSVGPLVDRADVLVYDAWVAGDAVGGQQLVSELREVYVDLPVVLTSVDQSVGWPERNGPHRVIPLGSRPSDTDLLEAIEIALGDQGMAV